MFDPIATFWIVLWVSIGSYGSYLLITDNKEASSVYVYGKSLNTLNKRGLFWQFFLVPKKYFKHFYLLSTCMFLTSFGLIIVYYTPSPFSVHMVRMLNIGHEYLVKSRIEINIELSNTVTKTTSLIFTLILMSIQTSRRLYETLFISVYSSTSKINLIHYVFGHIFYMGIAVSTICPILMSATNDKLNVAVLLDHLIDRKRSILFVLFVYASHYQYRCHQILANLRKDKTGKVISEEYFVPSGGLFEFVSCPHFLCEVIIYLIIILVQDFQSYYWNLIFLLVLTTQTINAVTEHNWYKKKYKDYPKHRKAIFPRLL